MLAAPKRSGNVVVGAIVAATCVAVGIGTIYLPFIADKDKLRGMNEDTDKVMKKQFEQMMAERKREQEQLQQAEENAKAGRPTNSMWKVLSSGGGSSGEKKGSQ